MRTKYLLVFMVTVTSLLMLAIYWPGLHGSFIFDDGPNILFAPGVKLEVLSWESFRQAWFSGGAGPSGRPIAQLSFALNYYFSGFSPFAFKVTNLAVHGACGVLVFGLMQKLLKSTHPANPERQNLFVSAAVTAFWLLHPIQLLPVLHVVQRMTSLSALFLLAALWLHIHGRERGGRTGAAWLMLAWGIFWPLSFFSKETGALFPMFALAWELIMRRSTQGGPDRLARVFAALSALVLLAGLAYALSPQAQWLWAGYDVRGFSLVERVLTESRVLWIYLGLIFAPRLPALGLYHDDIALSTGLLTPWTTLPSLLGLAGMVWVAWRVRTRAPLLAFGIAWFLIGHALESTVLPLEIAHEHRNYLPLFGVLLSAGWAIQYALERKESYQKRGIVLVSAALAGLTLLTAVRAQQFGDELRRNLTEVEHHPASARAQQEAGQSLSQLPESALPGSQIHAMARRHFQLASELDPNFKFGELGLIILNCKAALPTNDAELKELMKRMRATPFAPGDQDVLYILKEMSIAGTLCLGRSEVDGLFTAALDNPGVTPWVQAILHSWHADYLWLHERDINAARSALGQSLKLNPGNLSNRLKWAQLLMISGELEKSRQLLLQLRTENYSAEERNTINELLEAIKIK